MQVKDLLANGQVKFVLLGWMYEFSHDNQIPGALIKWQSYFFGNVFNAH